MYNLQNTHPLTSLKENQSKSCRMSMTAQCLSVILLTTRLPSTLCEIILSYHLVDARATCAFLLQTYGFIRFFGVLITIPTEIRSERRGDLGSHIQISTERKRNYQCRNFSRFWNAIIAHDLSRAHVFGKRYWTFEQDLINFLS